LCVLLASLTKYFPYSKALFFQNNQNTFLPRGHTSRWMGPSGSSPVPDIPFCFQRPVCGHMRPSRHWILFVTTPSVDSMSSPRPSPPPPQFLAPGNRTLENQQFYGTPPPWEVDPPLRCDPQHDDRRMRSPRGWDWKLAPAKMACPNHMPTSGGPRWHVWAFSLSYLNKFQQGTTRVWVFVKVFDVDASSQFNKSL